MINIIKTNFVTLKKLYGLARKPSTSKILKINV